MQVHGNHDRDPFGIERTAVNHRANDRNHDVDDFQEVQNKAQNEQNQHHQQEDREFVIKRFQELLDIMFPPERDDHKVQQLRSDQNGEHHRRNLGGFAHDGGQHPGGEQHPARIDQTKSREQIGPICSKEGNPAFCGDMIIVDPQIEIHPDQQHHSDGRSCIQDDLTRFALILKLAIGRQHHRTASAQCGRRGWVGDPAKDRPQNRHDQNQRREHHTDQFVFRGTGCCFLAAIQRQNQRDQDQDQRRPSRGGWADQQHIHQRHQQQAKRPNDQRLGIRRRGNTASQQQGQAEHDDDRGNSGPDRGSVRDLFRLQLRDFFLAQFLGFGHATGFVDGLLFGHGLIPRGLAMQVDHRRLTFCGHVGAQAGILSRFGKTGYGGALIANHTQFSQQHRPRNQGDRQTDKPSKAFAAADRFVIGMTQFDSGGFFRVKQRENKRISRIQHRQQDTRQHCGLEQCPHRYHSRFTQIGQRIGTTCADGAGLLCGGIQIPCQRPQQNDHDGRRDDLPQRPRGRNHPG